MDEDCDAILEAAGESPSMKVLDLSQNRILRLSGGLKNLVAALRSSRTLEDLRLMANDAESAPIIAAALASSRSLAHLSLHRSGKLGDEDSKAIASALPLCRSLLSIDLSWCSITDIGVSFLAAAIQQSASIRRVDLSNNKISADGRAALDEAVLRKGGSTSVDLARSEAARGPRRTCSCQEVTDRGYCSRGSLPPAVDWHSASAGARSSSTTFTSSRTARIHSQSLVMYLAIVTCTCTLNCTS